MHLWREFALTLAAALLAGWALPWPAAVDPLSRAMGGLVMALPFQAGYAVATLAGRRAPAWLHAAAGAAFVAWTAWAPAPLGLGSSAGGLGLLLLGGGPALALAVVAPRRRARITGITGSGGGGGGDGGVPRRRVRAAAAALFLWGAGILGTRLLLTAMVPAPARPAAAMVLGWVGGVYGLGRLGWALVRPMAVDIWFRREPPVKSAG